MDSIKQDALNHCMDNIVEIMDVDPVVDKLNAILTNQEIATIRVRNFLYNYHTHATAMI